MNREQLFNAAHAHAAEVWGEETGDIGAGADVLRRAGIDPNDFTNLALEVVVAAHATDTVQGLAALFLEGFVFAAWLAEKGLLETKA